MCRGRDGLDWTTHSRHPTRREGDSAVRRYVAPLGFGKSIRQRDRRDLLKYSSTQSWT